MKEKAGDIDEDLRIIKGELKEELAERSEQLRKRSILVIDDMSENLRTIKAVLEDEFTIRLARSGELAKSILNTVIVDLILLDIEMPEISGFEYLVWLKGNPVTRHIPVMFISSHSEPEIVRSAGTLEIAGYIKKPADPKLLKEKIRYALAKK